MLKRIYYDWNQIIKFLDKLAKLIEKDVSQFDGIYGIPRGGLPPAVILSHKLNLPLLLSPTKKSLIIDDISDTGKTLINYKPNKIATIFNTKWTKAKPDYFVAWKKSKDSWIVFPWEETKKKNEIKKM